MPHTCFARLRWYLCKSKITPSVLLCFAKHSTCYLCPSPKVWGRSCRARPRFAQHLRRRWRGVKVSPLQIEDNTCFANLWFAQHLRRRWRGVKVSPKVSKASVGKDNTCTPHLLRRWRGVKVLLCFANRRFAQPKVSKAQHILGVKVVQIEDL